MQREVVRCTMCGRSYPIANGIPTFAQSGTDDEIRAFFDAAARGREHGSKSYVPFRAPARDRQQQIFSRAMTETLGRWIPDGSTILDVGCGDGSLYSEVAARNHMAGVDFAIEMLPIARAAGFVAVQADARALPFAGDQFEAVICAEVVNQYSDAAPIISELARVCKPGGTVVISTLHAGSLLRAGARALARVRKTPPLAVPVVLRTTSQLTLAARQFGLQLTDVAWVLSPLTTLVYTRGECWIGSPLASNIIVRFSKAP